jgi:heme/copper-type cytochrome/quinol oxidase subunit 2
MKRSMYLHEEEWPCKKYIEKVESRSPYDLMRCNSKENMVRVWEGIVEGRWVEDQVESYGCLNSQGCEEVMRETVDWGVNMVKLTSCLTAAVIVTSSIMMWRMLQRIGNGSEKVYWHHESIEKSFMVINGIIVIASAIWIGIVHRNGPHVFSHTQENHLAKPLDKHSILDLTPDLLAPNKLWHPLAGLSLYQDDSLCAPSCQQPTYTLSLTSTTAHLLCNDTSVTIVQKTPFELSVTASDLSAFNLALGSIFFRPLCPFSVTPSFLLNVTAFNGGGQLLTMSAGEPPVELKAGKDSPATVIKK